MSKKVLVSGIQATGTLHVGNYFGAMKQNIELGNSGEYESYIFIADYHALTSVKNAEDLRRSTFNIACAYLACGLDTKKVALFKQSDVPEHTELAWIFNNIVTMPYLMRAHAFKDHEAKSKEVNVGLFDYPVLMAADILIYGADVVPVGQDQKQHIEYARDIAEKFNLTWAKESSGYFKLPKDYILKDVAIVPGIDGQKMSKSYGNVIPLFGSDEEIKKQVMKIVTDSKSPDDVKDPNTDNIFALHKLFQEEQDLKVIHHRYLGGDIGYKESKELLLAAIIKTISPWREKYEYYQTHPEEVYAVLQEGRVKARARAVETVAAVRQLVGLTSK
jgi:tryptophanyl-tRNA synthetase